MSFDYPELIGQLNDEERLRFYEILAVNITVNIRAVWSDDNLPDAHKVEGMKCLNEIMHMIVHKSAALRLGRNRVSEEELWGRIKHWVSLSPTIGAHVMWAIKTSYTWCVRQRGV
ncbi:MAG: hypothetical protein ACJ741_18420 [Pyrinomonadaceae bacterium]